MTRTEPAAAPTPSDGPVRYGAAMLRRFGWFYRVLGLGLVLDRVRFEDHSVERIREAGAKGPVVYVLLHRATLDHLALNAVLNRRRLPLSAWSNGTPSFFWQPVFEAWRDVFRRVGRALSSGRAPDPVRSGWVSRTLGGGSPITLFLDTDGTPGEAATDPMQAVLDAQARSPGAIQLLPVITVWDRAPEAYASEVRDFLLGSREAPSLFTKLRNLYLPGGYSPFVQVGEALDLAAFMERVPPERRRDSLRTLLRRYLKRESHVVRGPRLLPRTVLRSLVLDAPPMRRFAEEHATHTGQPAAQVRRRMDKEFERVAASFSWPLIRLASVALRPLFTRVFSGYDIRPEDVDRVRAAMRDGTAVLVPCHKSHVDYLLLSWIFYWHDLIVPHIVAGVNLAIWPVHYLLRGAGAFFIERSFQGAEVHARVFGRYLRELLLHRYTVEFFVEGGRTRTGRLLPPRLGVLDMVLETAAAAPDGHELTLLPIAIAYEQVAEEGAYQAELEGGEKRAESMGEIMKARRVLSRRFGRVFVRVGEPVRASEIVAEGWRDLPDAERHALLAHTGERLVHGIGRTMVVLPTAIVAMGLLAHDRLGIAHADLLARLGRFRELLQRAGLPEASSLRFFDGAVSQALDRFLDEGRVERLGEGADRVWRIVPEQRLRLDFHKNQVLHAVALPALVACAVRARPEPAFPAEALADDLGWLTRLLRRELVLDPDLDAAARLREGLDALVHHGALAEADGQLTVADVTRISEVHGLLRAVLESYRLVVAVVPRHDGKDVDAKALVAAVLTERTSALATGLVTRPEAFDAVTLRAAVGMLREDRVLAWSGKRLSVDAEAARVVQARLTAMVDG